MNNKKIKNNTHEGTYTYAYKWVDKHSKILRLHSLHLARMYNAKIYYVNSSFSLYCRFNASSHNSFKKSNKIIHATVLYLHFKRTKNYAFWPIGKKVTPLWPNQNAIITVKFISQWGDAMNDKPATKKKIVCNEWDVGFGGLRGDEVGMNDSVWCNFFFSFLLFYIYWFFLFWYGARIGLIICFIVCRIRSIRFPYEDNQRKEMLSKLSNWNLILSPIWERDERLTNFLSHFF